MNIKVFSINDLKKNIANERFWQQPVLPITRQRAVSQVNNPHAQEDDTALIVAYKQNPDTDGCGDIIGYFGLLPVLLRTKEQLRKIYWGTTWWIDPKAQSPMLGAYLLMGALEYSANLFVASAYTQEAAALYDQMPALDKAQHMKGKNFICQLPDQNKEIKKKLLTPLLNKQLKCRQKHWEKNHRLNINTEAFSYPDQEISSFIQNQSKKDLLTYDTQKLDWLLHYPWVLSNPLTDRKQTNYFFSSTVSNFKYFPLKVYDGQTLKCFGILRLRDNFLTVPYACITTGSEYLLAQLLAHIIIKLNIQALTLYDDALVTAFEQLDFPVFKTENTQKPIIFSRELSALLPDSYHLQDGDGDCIFT